MKKILSILICVVLGVGNLWAATVTIKTTCVPTNGGTFAVKTKTATEYKNFRGWKWPSAWSSTNVGTPQYNGGLVSHSVGIMYQLTATTKAGYYFEKWTGVPVGKVATLGDCTEETINEVTETPPCEGTTTYEGTTKYVSSDKVYDIKAIFRRYYLATLYGYNVENDQFETTPLGNVPAESADYTDMLEMNVSNFEKLYKLSFNHPVGNIDDIVYSSEKFIVDIKTIGTDTVMVVKNKGAIDEQVSDAITLYVKNEWNKGQTVNGIIATLNFTVSNKPIYVTLNPAEDLSGTYTYTQNTTGSTTFNVTTSAIVKQMTTSTDYSFTFSPKPNDATKYKFSKWVIKDAEGVVKAEPITAELSYRFTGGESITPVFVPIDIATYIVKSEPTITYVDLQQALDRADALTTSTGKAQTVVVTSSTGKLLQGNYTIRNGVTLLIPGESSYTALLGDLNKNNFSSSGTYKTYCKLSVEDNTKITVENGNISIYAKLTNTQAGISNKKGSVYEHGHLELGKNCEIDVKKGGLYAFGFITGDNSNKITMRKNTIAYEPFHMTDWRGGGETIGNWVDVMIVGGTAGIKSRVFPIGQYYIQNVEVPLTFEYGSKERISCCVDASLADAPVNMTLISTYNEECLFGLGDGTTITKSYDPATDRVKYEYKGTGASSSKVKLGCMNLKLDVSYINVDVNSKDYVMPIQNNIDVDVKNTTIDVEYDMAFMPGSTMRVHDDAVINVGDEDGKYKPNVYIYDRGARKLNNGSPYWFSGISNYTEPIIPVYSKFRPGGIKYTRTDADLYDACLIINGDMNIRGGLYTVKGAWAEADALDPDALGGANITSEGSGKINVYSLGSSNVTVAKQWLQDVGVQELALTSPKLLLHNDLSKGAASAYTPVTETGISYTYYQYDGTWREPKAGATGVKLYDSEGNEIENFLVTLPTTTSVDGYLLVTLEQTGDAYNVNHFTISLTEGAISCLGGNTIVDGNLKVPVRYTTKNVQGTHTQTLTIKYSGCAECDLVTPISAIEDYTPVFKVPTSLNIYARINERTPGSLPITAESDNVVSLAENNTVNLTWDATIEGTNKTMFEFALGEGTGNKLAGASVYFTPNNTTKRTATLKLTAKYTDSERNEITSATHSIPLTGNGLMIDNTLDFNNVGTITVNTSAFELLKYINSTGKITYTVLEGTVNQAGSPIHIAANNSNYTIKPNAVGQVKLQISQAATTTHTAKTITTTIIVVADPQPLVTEMCLDNSNFSILTADIEHAKYEDAKLKFEGDGVISSWTAQFSTMPGTLTFIPHGDGYWAVQESKDGINWSEIIWWTQLPSYESVTYALHPTTRRVKISYNKVSEGEDGYISQLCITPFTVHAETTKIYAPVVGGIVQPTSVVFTHSTPSVTFEGPSDWTVDPLVGSTTNLGGVLNTYYQTTVTVSGGNSVEELNNGFELKATQGTDEAIVTIGTYTFPKPLPMESEEWVSDDDPTNNNNNYDESEYYYHYMRTSKNVKWDAERENLVFMNVGSKTGEAAKRQVVFGYFGLPDVVRFQSTATDWTIEQSTNGIDWNPVDGEARTINTVDEVHSIAQTIESTSQYVRITYTGTQQDEVLLSKLVIEGLPSAVPSSSEVQVSKGEPESSETFSVHVKNLPSMQLSVDNTAAFSLQYQKGGNWVDLTNALTTSDFDCLAVNQQGDITFKVIWEAQHVLDEGAIQIINPNQNNSVMAVIRLVGKKDEISSTDVNTGIWTGVPDGVQNGSVEYLLESTIFDDYDYHEVKLNNTFSNDQKALFDYLIIYGETTTDDATPTITKPTAEVGSNAKTPYYVYKKNANSTGYDFVSAVANANISEKALVRDFIVNDDTATVCINAINAPLRVYITGFCPYATTGYTKNQEGVFLFRGKHGSQLDIYLEDCHIYSRNKTEKGSTFYGDKEGGEIYSDKYARGSGGVLVFENVDAQEQLQSYDPFEVSIHTIGNNLLNSNHGCFFGLKIGVDVAMKAYQVSSPIQIHMLRDGYERKTKTNLTFDDVWPIAVDANNVMTDSIRTNGFLALKKQANNAPSIDLGNQYTVVNFNGGRVQLQNSQIGSDTYKTTLAISYRAGLFGADGAGIKLCYGIGTDAVDGTVNFNDGTVTVERMWVDPAYRQYYLMDEVDGVETGYTTCLRTPKNTFIKGGSICRVRACVHVTSKGGGPRENNTPSARLLGQYEYTKQEGDTEDPNTHLVTINGFPDCVDGLESYAYNLNSVTADANDKFYFWIPDRFGGVEAEQDKLMSTWKACMTQITAGIPGVADGTVGGDIDIDDTEEVKYFLYCQLDDNTYDVISEYDGETSDGKKKYTYKAPIEVPSAAREFFKGDYTRWAPNEVGEFKQYQVTSDAPYTITDKAYYITTATADVWQTFTAPFDVANIYVVETFSEKELEKNGTRTRAEILKDQAVHNADFAAFFGVAMAMGTDKSFEQIFDSYINWGMMMDRDSFLLYNPVKDGNYTLRGMQKLTPYFGNNWRDANFYLNVNNGEWTYDDSDFGFKSHWEMLTQAGWDEEGILLHKGETYSMLFPYCTGCGTDLDSREYWDYWSGKFLIFESTDAPQTINGRDYLDETTQGNIFATKTSDVDNNVVVTGNSTFAYMTPTDKDVYVYVPLFKDEYFDPITSEDVVDKTIYPTNAFLYGNVPAHPYTNMPAKRVTREGKIIYGESGDNNGDPNNGTTTGSHTPTVGGGNDMFITAIDGGINIAVAAPQMVCVVNATGHIIFNGYVTTNTNVLLPMNGIYVVKGQNEVQKIFF